MSEVVSITLDGVEVAVPSGVTVAAAVLSAGNRHFRRDGNGAPRAPLCGMGTCFECRVTIDGVAECRACMVAVAQGMLVETAR